MAPYSMDLRKRVAKAWDVVGDADVVAAQYDVSRAWVHRLIQRRRETGSLAPRKQISFGDESSRPAKSSGWRRSSLPSPMPR
jgi:transposase